MSQGACLQLFILLLFSLQTHIWVYRGAWERITSLAPLKERWCPHHILCFFCFFVGLLWNFFMVCWACSIFNSFTQDASIGWYPFHSTKYSRFCPLSCLDLRITSTSNFSSLWITYGGVLQLCFWLGLEASWETNFKSDTWNMGWTLNFFNSPNL